MPNYNLRDLTNESIDNRTTRYNYSVPYDQGWDISQNAVIVPVVPATNHAFVNPGSFSSPAPTTPGPERANIIADNLNSSSIPSSTTNTIANNNRPTFPDSPMVADTNTPPPNSSPFIIIHMRSSAYTVQRNSIPFLVMLARWHMSEYNLEENRHTMRIRPDNVHNTVTVEQYPDLYHLYNNQNPPINVVLLANNNSHPANTSQPVTVPSRTDANLNPSSRDGLDPVGTDSALNTATNVTSEQSISVGDSLERTSESKESQCPSSKEAQLESSGPNTEKYKDLEHVPGLYQQVTEDEWECLFRTEIGICPDAITGKGLLQSHIAMHALEEEKAILEGKLLPEEAVAIPRRTINEDA